MLDIGSKQIGMERTTTEDHQFVVPLEEEDVVLLTLNQYFN